MRTSQAGIDLIIQFESLKLVAYKCPANVWTIGVGHTRTAKPGMKITRAEAMRLLREDLREFEDGVNKLLKGIALEQNQFDAVISLTFNIGLGAFGKSSVLKRIRERKFEAVPAAMMLFTYANKKQLAGLVRRRRAECALWRSHDTVDENEGEARIVAEPAPTRPLITSGTVQGGGAAVLGGLGVVSQQASEIRDAVDPFLSGGTIMLICLGVVIVLGGALAIWRRYKDRELIG